VRVQQLVEPLKLLVLLYLQLKCLVDRLSTAIGTATATATTTLETVLFVTTMTRLLLE
jgi:hypothetical protein